MQVFFVNAKLARHHVDHPVISGDEVAGLLDERGITDGTPVYLDDETMMPLEPLCSWGRKLSGAELAEGTMKDYGASPMNANTNFRRQASDYLPSSRRRSG